MRKISLLRAPPPGSHLELLLGLKPLCQPHWASEQCFLLHLLTGLVPGAVPTLLPTMPGCDLGGCQGSAASLEPAGREPERAWVADPLQEAASRGSGLAAEESGGRWLLSGWGVPQVLQRASSTL